jgi:alpha-N-arabinofuranosidase
MNSPEADWQSAQPQVLAEQPLAQSIQNLGLRISASGRTHQVHYSTEPGGEWSPLKTDIDGSFLSTAIAGGFQGVTIGMFARTTRQ